MLPLAKLFSSHKSKDKKVLELIEKVKNGDLSDSADSISSKNEVIRNLCHMSDSLNEKISSVSNSTNNVSLMIDNVNTNAYRVMEESKNQAEKINSIAVAIDEMSQTITTIARDSADTLKLSETASGHAVHGKEIADSTMKKNKIIIDSVFDLTKKIEALNTSIHEINIVVNIIKDIADQTNLLALNAAIEAARAGEQGRGFAVVADEVRKLAEKTVQSTANITNKIETVQKESSKTFESMQRATKEIDGSINSISEMSDCLTQVNDIMGQMRDRVHQIASATEEQSSVSEEIARDITATSAITKENEKMARIVLAESIKLLEIEESLRKTVLQFRTKNFAEIMVDVGAIDHRRFVKRILSAITGNASVNPGDLPDHHTCRFGKWYDSEGMKYYGNSPSFKQIIHPHEKVHALAKDILNTNKTNNFMAKQLYEKLESESDKIMELLKEVKKNK